MSFIKDHLVPILHGTIAHFIAWLVVTVVIASGAFLALTKVARVSAFSIITVKVPLWSVVSIVALFIVLFIRSQIRKRVKIRSANYGFGAFQADVTARVQAHLNHGVLDVLATTEVLRDGNDPCPEHTKGLAINYTLNGRDRRVEVIEGSRLILP